MRHTILILTLLATFAAKHLATAQCYRFAKEPIADTQRFAYFPLKPEAYDTSVEPGLGKIYTTTVECEGVSTGIILIEFESKKTESKEELEAMLCDYINVTRDMLGAGIGDSKLFGKGHEHSQNKSAHGIIDFAESEKYHISIKAWIDPNCAALLFVAKPKNAEKEYPYNAEQMFLNGFRFSN